MYHDLVKIEYLSEYKLRLTFENGKQGIIDFQNYINKGGIFSRLSDINFFKKAFVNKELGVLCWPGDVDIAPETLYNEATGESLPTWMEVETDNFKSRSSNNKQDYLIDNTI